MSARRAPRFVLAQIEKAFLGHSAISDAFPLVGEFSIIFSFFLASQKQNLLTHIEASYFFSEADGGGATKALVFVLIHNHPTHLCLDELLIRSQSWVKNRKLLMLCGVVDSSSMGKSS